MKKIANSLLFTIIITVLILSSCGPKKYVNYALRWAKAKEKLDTALNAANKATEFEETKTWPKTYYVRGLVYQTIANSEKSEFQRLVDDPLIFAYKNYNQAYEMGEMSKATKTQIDLQIIEIYKRMNEKAATAFQNSNFENAFKYFKYSSKVKEMPVYNEIDTANYFNAALSAFKGEMWDSAATYMKKSIKYDYGGEDLYLLLKNCYQNIGDSTAMLNALKSGFEAYPNSKNIVIELVNYYLFSGETEAALEYIARAKKQDPGNASLYFAEGTLYDKMDKTQKAIEAYKKAIERNDEYFDAYYNLGVIFYNRAVELTDIANEETDDELYEKKKARADSVFREALPYFERANEIRTDDLSTLQNLKTLYYRFQQMDKYEEITAKLEELQGRKEENNDTNIR